MRIRFKKLTGRESLGINFFWQLTIESEIEESVQDHFIPELFFDYFYLKSGRLSWHIPNKTTKRPLAQQALKGLFTTGFILDIQLPLTLFGARFSLSFAESFWQQLGQDFFLTGQWVPAGIATLPEFANHLTTTVSKRQTNRFPASLLAPGLAEPQWLSIYSARHKRRLFKSTFGVNRKQLISIQSLHHFLGKTCDFSLDNPRLIEYVDYEAFYDQPHLNRMFKKMTHLSPLAYFEASTILQDNLMAASYNTGSD